MDRGVIATAAELFEARHFPGVVAMCTDALESEPECVELMVIRARAHIGLRRELDAQADLREIIRLEPQCGIAYRLLGELAARRDENESAAIFFREAIRLDPDDQQARDWLQIVDVSLRPAAAARKFPAGSAAAAGRFPVTRAPVERGRSAGSPDGANRTLSAPARTEQRPGSQARFARGTRPPTEQDERPTKPFGRGSARNGDMWKTPTPHPIERTMDLAEGSAPAPILPTPSRCPRRRTCARRKRPRTSRSPAARPRSRPHPRPRSPRRARSRGPTPELPGFGEYLITAGIISRDRLRAAQAYQRSMKVHLSTAIVTLGLATPQRIEWAAVAHQSQLARERQQQP